MTTAHGGLAGPGGRLPRITLVTPSFNQADYLEATLDSVLGQRYPELEYIVIDGGSTDGSVDILRRNAERLSYWVSEPDRGHAHALNKGFARATGEVMGWINSDDILLPGSLLLVGSLFAQFPEMEWLTSPGAATEPAGRIVAAHDPVPWTRARFLRARDQWIQQESTFWRRDLWRRSGARLAEGLLACDHELWARFFRHARLYQTSGLIGAFRYRPDQRSSRLRERYLAEMSEIVAREAARQDQNPLLDDEAEVCSEISFDAETLTFVCRHSAAQLNARAAALCAVDDALLGGVRLQALEPPPGGIEGSPEIRRFLPTLLDPAREIPTFVWLGAGELAGLAIRLHALRSRTARLRFVAAPGPSAGGKKVTLRLSHRAKVDGGRTVDFALSAEEAFAVDLALETGRNTIGLHVLENAVLPELGTGDPRQLMAAVAEIGIAAGPDAGENREPR